jgi:hypothetical protein
LASVHLDQRHAMDCSAAPRVHGQFTITTAGDLMILNQKSDSSVELVLREESMRSSHAGGRTLAASLVAFGIALAATPAASADPADPAQTDAGAVPPGPPPAAEPAPVSADGADAASIACKQFSGALNFAATHYEEFAYATAGGGNYVNYSDPSVTDSNTVGRTALREAAGAAMNASMAPGLQPEISAPMQRWSLRATKLLVIMGLRGGGDSLNSTAGDLNTDARDVQMACAAAGVPA